MNDSTGSDVKVQLVFCNRTVYFFIEVPQEGISISRYVSIWGFRPGNV